MKRSARFFSLSSLVVVTTLLLGAACGGQDVPTPIDDGGSSDSSAAESGSDAGADSGFDAGTDSGFDAGEDSGSKAEVDSGFDAGTDSGFDARADSGFDAGEDSGSDAEVDSGLVIPAVRPISPLATATVTSQTPTFHWKLPAGADGATVLLCRDRALSTSCTAFSATGSSARPPNALSPGVWFWRLTGRSGSVEGTATGPIWEFFVGHGSAPVDTSWGTTLDVNGDGYADVVVGAWGSNTAYFYLGSAAGVASASATTLTGPSGSGHFGASVASAGDVNGDGYADVVVGAWGSHTAYVYLGSAAGVASASVTTLTGPSGSSLFGATVASAGDVNGDGYADVVVGADGTNAAYVYLGSAAGVASVPVTLTGSSGSYFGATVASAGDVNGDGYTDVVVGANGSNTAYVYLGSAAGVASVPVTLTGPSGSSFGLSVASAGDVNGDGYADVVVGADGTNTAYVYLGSGSATGVASASVMPLTGPSASSFGVSVASAGDVNGDGCADVVVGAEGSNTAYVYLGGGSAASALARLVVLTGPSGSSFGYSVASAGDLNGDGYADVVVGADNSNAYVYPGSGSVSGVASASVTTLIGPSGSLDFGVSVASAGDVIGGTAYPLDKCLPNWVLL